MRIGELARRSNLSRDTIRFYERNGLIRSAPSQSRTNSYRDYPDDTLDTLAVIRQAQHAGFSIADLAIFLNDLEPGSFDDFDADDFLQHKIEAVEETIRRAEAFLDILKATRRALMPRRE